MPSKPIELPPEVAKAFVADMRAAVERAAEARKQADRLTCEAWNKRMLAFKGPAHAQGAYDGF
jgi:hypothetical protein